MRAVSSVVKEGQSSRLSAAIPAQTAAGTAFARPLAEAARAQRPEVPSACPVQDGSLSQRPEVLGER